MCWSSSTLCAFTVPPNAQSLPQDPPFTQKQWRVSNVIVLQSFSQTGDAPCSSRSFCDSSIYAAGSDCPVNLKICIVDIQCRGYAAVLGADFDFLMAR